MKVLRVADIPEAGPGGMVGAIRRSSEALEAAGHEVSFLFREHLVPGCRSPRLRRLVVPWAVAARAERLQKLCHFDVVEVHEPIAAAYAMLVSTRLGRRRLPPLVVLSHGIEERCWRTVLERRAATGVRTSLWSRTSVALTLLSQTRIALRRADRVVVLNRADHDYLRQIGLPPTHISQVANGVEPELLAVSRRPAQHLRVLFLGSWLERKGVAELASAWVDVHVAHPSARLTLAGFGQAQPLALFPDEVRASVELVPLVPRPALAELLAVHDVFVLPSWFEGMPLATLEAAAASLAVVATRIPGIVDIFRPPDPHLDGAILVDGGRPRELGLAIGSLASDRGRLVELQAAARRRAAAFTWTATANGLAAAYAMARKARLPPGPA